MKLLVIGIDGADSKVIGRMPMPVLQSLLRQGVAYDTKVDLWSRGWAEIFTGRHGRDTGAFYNKPACMGRYDFTENFNLTSLVGNTQIRPIWDELTDRGYRVGVMNIPTTLPAPPVNGFFVSGVGGGSAKSGESYIPPEACYPAAVKDVLEQMGYVLDVRRAKSGITDLEEFFQAIKAMEKKRTESFVHLARTHDVDFGFVGYVGISRVCYLLMADILALGDAQGSADTKTGRLILDFFSYNDQLFKNLLEELSPERVLIVSDHGMAPYKHNVNLNVFLQQGGWQTKNKSVDGWVRQMSKAAKNMLPVRFRRNLGKKMPGVRQFVGGADYVAAQTRAVAARYIPGIYVNDSRFGGSSARDQGLINEIVTGFNEYEPARALGMTAIPYASDYKGCYSEASLPDIWIEHPDSVFFKDSGPFVAPNPQYKPFDTFADVDSDMNSGIKGSAPIVCMVGETETRPRSTQQPGNLTQVYELIKKNMD